MSEPLRWEQVRAELLSDPEAAAEYEALGPQYELITQAQLAERTGLRQSNISRLEGGNCNPSLELMNRVARGLGMRLHIELLPLQETI